MERIPCTFPGPESFSAIPSPFSRPQAKWKFQVIYSFNKHLVVPSNKSLQLVSFQRAHSIFFASPEGWQEERGWLLQSTTRTCVGTVSG